MTWVKIDDQFADHPKWAGASDGAIAAWVKGLAYCSRYLTDGFVPDAYVKTIATAKVRAELLERKGWKAARGGVRAVNYEEVQRTRSEVDEAKEATRKRVAKHRAKKRTGNAVTPPDVTTPEVETEPERDNPPNPPASEGAEQQPAADPIPLTAPPPSPDPGCAWCHGDGVFEDENGRSTECGCRRSPNRQPRRKRELRALGAVG